MKRAQYNKLVGLCLGESSLQVAEVTHGEKPSVRRAAEFVYPAGTSLAEPAALGKALGDFLRDQGFSTKAAVVGIPAKWLAVKSKDVPPADEATLADILRLQAEGDFSSELKDLVYDYAGRGGQSVLLVATPRKHVDAATALCTAAGLTAIAVTPSVIALGAATGRAVSKDAMVLSVVGGAPEFAAQHDLSPVAVRTLRSASTGELRRALSGVPMNGSARELVLWDGAGLDAMLLGNGVGVPVRSGDLSTFGIDTAAAANLGATGRKYAAAIALALEAGGDRTLAIDFLHSRLAPKKKPLVPRWAVLTAVAVVLGAILSIAAYSNLQSEQAALVADRAKLKAMDGDIKSADAFVAKVSFAQAWHSSDARYVACVRDLTAAVPDDGQTYATRLLVREVTQAAKNGKQVQTGQLSGTLYGKTTDQKRVQVVLDAIKKSSAFADVTNGGTQDAGRGKEVTFSIAFTYRPGAPASKGAGK